MRLPNPSPPPTIFSPEKTIQASPLPSNNARYAGWTVGVAGRRS